jgi:hypothetical protein
MSKEIEAALLELLKALTVLAKAKAYWMNSDNQ